MRCIRSYLIQPLLSATILSSAALAYRTPSETLQRSNEERKVDAAREVPPALTQLSAWEQWTSSRPGNWSIAWDKRTGSPEVIVDDALPPGLLTKPFVTLDARPIAKRVFEDHASLFGLRPADDEMRIVRTSNSRNVHKVRFEQFYHGIRVETGGYTVTLRRDGSFDMLGGRAFRGVTVDVRPRLDRTAARDLAFRSLGLSPDQAKTWDTDLVIVLHDGNYRLAHVVPVRPHGRPESWRVYVDAGTGEVLRKVNVAHYAGPGAVASAATNPPAEKKDGTASSCGFYDGHFYNNNYCSGFSQLGPLYNLYPYDDVLDGTFVSVTPAGARAIANASCVFNYPPPGNPRQYDPTPFDQVNLYHHVDTYLDQFIWGELSYYFPYQLPVFQGDLGPTGGAYFDPDGPFGEGSLHFGVGNFAGGSDGYDPAKNREVIVHEVTHAVLSVRGLEPDNFEDSGAISEGTADYFTASFTASGAVMECQMAGGCNSQALRNIDDPTFRYYFNSPELPFTYCDGFPIAEQHKNGLIWSSALWDLRKHYPSYVSYVNQFVFDAMENIGDPSWTQASQQLLSEARNNIIVDYCVLKEIMNRRQIPGSILTQPGIPVVSAPSGQCNITLSWPHVANATEYFIDYPPGRSDVTITVPDFPPGSFSHTDFNAPESPQTYSVTARHCSVPGLPRTVTATRRANPGAPPTASLTTLDPCTVRITWGQATNVDGYKIYKNGVLWRTSVGVTPVPQDDGLVTVATTYCVKGYNCTNRESATQACGAQRPATPPAAIPSNVSADQGLSTTTVTIRWTDNSTDESGFKVFRRLGAGPETVVASPGANSTSAPDTPPDLQHYTYCVRSVKCGQIVSGDGPSSCGEGWLRPAPPAGFTEDILPTINVVSLAFSPQAKPSILYVIPSTNRPMYASRANGVWTPSQIENLQAFMVSVAMDAVGNPHVTYVDRSGPVPTTWPLRYAKRTGTTWSPELIDSAIQGYVSSTSDMTLDASGTPWVAYADHDGLVRVAYRGTSGGWTPEHANPGGGSLGIENVNIVMRPGGGPVITYCEGYGQLVCCIRNGPNSWVRELVDTPSSVLFSVANSLRINASGQVVIAYYRPEVDQLKIATRIGPSNWTYLPTVASGLSSSGSVNPKLDIDSAGNLHLVYTNWTAQLKIYAKKIGASPWTFQTLSGAVASAKHLMRLSAAGKPRIATRDVLWDSAWEMVAPSAGTSWIEGSSQVVSWAGTGAANVEVSLNGGSTFQGVVSNVTGDQVAITVPLVSATITNAQVRVSRISPAVSAVVSPLTITNDIVPPAPTPYLVSTGGCDSIFVDWQATGNDGHVGTAAAFDLRWNASPIPNDAAFNGSSAVPVVVPMPGPPGTQHRIAISMGPCSARWYFAIKIRDGAGNWSALTSDPWGSSTACVQWPMQCADLKPGQIGGVPLESALTGLGPNPTRGWVDVRIALAREDDQQPIELSVFDVAGRRVRMLRQSNLAAGRHILRWDTRDDQGRSVSAGIYFVRLRVATRSMTQRLVVVR